MAAGIRLSDIEDQEERARMTPPSWRFRAGNLPPWVRPHFRDLRAEERKFLDGVAATTTERALRDAEGEKAP